MSKVYGKSNEDRRALLQVFTLICSVDESEHSDESGTTHEMEVEEEGSAEVVVALPTSQYGQARNIPKSGCQLRP